MGKINYEHMDKAAELIAAFRAEIKDICGKYEELMTRECPENIAATFYRAQEDCERAMRVQLYGCDGGFTSEGLIADGFSVDYINEEDKTVWYEKEYKGTTIVIGVDYSREETADEG